MKKRNVSKVLISAVLALALLLSGCAGIDESLFFPAENGARTLAAETEGNTETAAAEKPEESAAPEDKTAAEENKAETKPRDTRIFLIDTDMSADDAVALSMAALAPEVVLMGVTTVYGAATAAQAAQNALMTLETCGAELPVFSGAEAPLFHERMDYVSCNGDDGMGDHAGLIAPTGTVEKKDAADFILEVARENPDQVELLVLGPATNVGLAALRDRKTMSHFKRIWVMGSVGTGQGSVTPVADFNAYSDIDAYTAMLRCGCPVTFIGADLAADAVLDEEATARLENGNALEQFLYTANSGLLAYNRETLGKAVLSLNDPIAMTAALRPEYAKAVRARAVCCDNAADPAYGQVIFYRENAEYLVTPAALEPNCELVTAVDAEAYRALLFELLDSSKNAAVNYDEERDALIAETAVAVPELTGEEQKLDALLTLLRTEAVENFGGQLPSGFPILSDPRFSDTRLYEFCKALPKGGDLHSHDFQNISFDGFIEVLSARENVLICLEEGENYGCLYLEGDEKLPEGTVALGQALKDEKVTYDQLRAILTMADAQAELAVWGQFEALFGRVSRLYGDMGLIEAIYEQAMRESAANHIGLLELRVLLTSDDDTTNTALLEAVRDAYYAVKKDHPDFLVRVIACAGKKTTIDKEDTLNVLRSGVRLSGTILDESDKDNQLPFIIGLDLINEEDASNPLSEYAEFFNSDEVRDSGLKLFLHGGESLTQDNSNLVDAYLLGTQRIGHGFSLLRFLSLAERYRQRHICMEVCPVSNHTLGYVPDLRLHPSLTLYRTGMPVALCSDDGLFQSKTALVDDYYAAALYWELPLAELKALAHNAIAYAGLSAEETAALETAWEAQWSAFVKEALESFASQEAEETEAAAETAEAADIKEA